MRIKIDVFKKGIKILRITIPVLETKNEIDNFMKYVRKLISLINYLTIYIYISIFLCAINDNNLSSTILK